MENSGQPIIVNDFDWAPALVVIGVPVILICFVLVLSWVKPQCQCQPSASSNQQQEAIDIPATS